MFQHLFRFFFTVSCFHPVELMLRSVHPYRGRAFLTLFSASMGDFDLSIFDERDRHSELLPQFDVMLGRTFLVVFVLFAFVSWRRQSLDPRGQPGVAKR